MKNIEISKAKILSLMVTIAILALLVLTGPVKAFMLGLIISNTEPIKGELVYFTATIEIKNTERLPISNLSLGLQGPLNVSCIFYPNGSIISGCQGISIQQLSGSNFSYGSGYGYYGYGYNFGYGYGFTGGNLSYNITLNTTDYLYGLYKTKLIANIGNKTFSGQGQDLLIRGLINITNLPVSPSCITELDSVILSANITNLTGEINEVAIGIEINGTWANRTNINKNGSLYYYILNSSELIRGNVSWLFYAKDDAGYLYKGAVETFYVNSKTKLSVFPSLPDGLDNWYITEPNFTLENPNASNMWYRWDGKPTLLYIGSFGLENITNPPPESAGTLKLTWWGDACSDVTGKNESEQHKMFYIDLTNPLITNLQPANNSTVYNALRSTIQAYLDEVYQSNSGINKSSVVIKLDGSAVSKNILSAADPLDAIVRHIPNSDLGLGKHYVSVNASDNAGRNSELTWFFYINITAVFNMTVYSPENSSYYSAYGSKRVQFNITTTEDVSKIEYINWNEKKPEWGLLCRNCDEYGYTRRKTKNLNEGWNNITIRGVDKFGNVKEENRTLFIDSKEPVISKTEPARNKVINGSEFKVKYTEDNINQVILTYGNIHGYSSIILNCSPGRAQECLTTAGLSSYDGQWIDFWFNVSDFVRSVESRKTRVEVDTKVPELTINNPVNTTNTTYGRRVRLDINASEKVILEYYDAFAQNSRWRTLCARCSSYNRTKSFARGFHEVTVRARDEADNSDSETRSFSVDY